MELLIRDVSDFSTKFLKMGEFPPQDVKEQFLNFRRLLKGVVEWAAWLTDFAVLHGVRLNDASPRNTGYDKQDGKWKVIDAGCYKIVGRDQGVTIESTWKILRNALYRFKAHYSCAYHFRELLDSTIAVYVKTHRIEVLDEDVECVIRRRTPDVYSGHRKVNLLAAQGLPSASLAAQTLLRGEAAEDSRCAAAIDVGARFLQGQPEEASPEMTADGAPCGPATFGEAVANPRSLAWT